MIANAATPSSSTIALPSLRQIAITVLCLLALRLGAYLPLPGTDINMIGSGLGGASAIERISIMALAALPWVSAAIFFELIRALFPFVRGHAIYKHGFVNPFHSWVVIIAIMLACVQSFGIMSALSSMGLVTDEFGFVGVFSGLIGGVAMAIIAAWLIDRFGTGYGFWTIFGFQSVLTVINTGVIQLDMMRMGAIKAEAFILDIALFVLIVFGVVHIFRALMSRDINAIDTLLWPLLVSNLLVGLALSVLAYFYPALSLKLYSPDGGYVFVQALIVVAGLAFLILYLVQAGVKSAIPTATLVYAAALTIPFIMDAVGQPGLASLSYLFASGQIIALVGVACALIPLQGRRSVRGNP